MKTANRLDFINGKVATEDIRATDKLQMISTTKIHSSEELELAFQQVIKNQTERKKLETNSAKKDEKIKAEVIKDDAFANIDKELGF